MAMKLSELHKSNWFAIGLLITGAILAVIAGVGYVFNRSLFTSFSWIVFSFIGVIALYMLYNIKKILDEIKRSKGYNNNSKK